MARIDHRDVTTLVLERLRVQLSASMLVLAAHEAAPPGNPADVDYAAVWCRLSPPAFEMLRRPKKSGEPDMAVLSLAVQVVADTRATGLAPLAIETAAESVAVALDEYCEVSGTLTVTLGRAHPNVMAEPDAENRFRTALVTVAGLAEKT